MANCRWPWLKKRLIAWFIQRYEVDLSEAVETNPLAYPHFNGFFTRALRPECRPIKLDDHTFVSPADGSVSQCGTIEQGTLMQAKGFYFNAQTLLGGNKNHAKAFESGSFTTIYLAPKNYHRVHMPCTGKLIEMIYVPGQLFSVNTHTAEHIPNLFARNERVVCLFETTHGLLAVVLIGAMLVASIETVWAGLVAPKRPRTITSLDYRGENITITQGAELGRFALGSTVVVLSNTPKLSWQDFKSGDAVQMGQILGDFKNFS